LTPLTGIQNPMEDIWRCKCKLRFCCAELWFYIKSFL